MFGQTARALWFIIKLDQNPTLPKDQFTRDAPRDFSVRQQMYEASEADMF